MRLTTSRTSRLCSVALAASLFVGLSVSAIAAPPPQNITSFQKLNPPSVEPSHFGWDLEAVGDRVLVSGFDNYSYIYDIHTRAELLRFRSSDWQLNDLFGQSVALSEDYAVVGANAKQTAYVFNAHTGQQLRKFSDPNAPPLGGFAFGTEVAVDGNFALIGDNGDDTNGSDAGAAYLYNIVSDQLVHTYLPTNLFAIGHGFGAGLDIQGNSLIVGAPGAPGSFNSSSGAAYVYDTSSLNVIRTLVPTDGAPSRNFGRTVEIAGNLVMIGDSDISGTGHAYLFNWQTGQQLRKFVSPNPNSSGSFSLSIAFDGSRALIGSWAERIDGTLFDGTAYLFDVQTGDLLATLLPDELKSTSSEFSFAVAMSGNTLLASGTPDVGRVYLVTIPEPQSFLLAATCMFCPRGMRRRSARRLRDDNCD